MSKVEEGSSELQAHKAVISMLVTRLAAAHSLMLGISQLVTVEHAFENQDLTNAVVAHLKKCREITFGGVPKDIWLPILSGLDGLDVNHPGPLATTETYRVNRKLIAKWAGKQFYAEQQKTKESGSAGTEGSVSVG